MSKIWNFYRIKDIAKVSRGASPRPIQNYLTDDEVNGIPWIKISDATKVKKYIESTEEYIIPSGAGKSNLVLPGDLIVSNSATPGIPRFLKIKACIHDGWLLLRKLKNVKKEFLFYLIESIRSKLKNQGTGSIFINLSIDILANEVVFIPTLEEQTKIANYLDIETSKIDRKVSILEQKYEKLEEYKQSVIFETITKGLDNNVPMKDSGIDWIGEIPAHWEVKRVKDFLNLKGGGVDKKVIEGETLVKLVNFVDVFKKLPLNNKQDYMVVSCPKDKIKGVSLIENDILITPSSETPKEIGLANIVLENLKNTVFSYHILRLRNIHKNIPLIPKYTYYYFNSKFAAFQFEGKALGTTRVTLSRYDILSNIFFQPTKGEQQKIADYLDEICTKINKKKDNIAMRIELLKEYKQSLIYEAVTGKLDIE